MALLDQPVSPQARLRRWLERWRELKISPPLGLTDDMRDAADVLDRVDAAISDHERRALAGPQAAAAPPWGWGEKRDPA